MVLGAISETNRTEVPSGFGEDREPTICVASKHHGAVIKSSELGSDKYTNIPGSLF
jgi:hypothetical protein